MRSKMVPILVAALLSGCAVQGPDYEHVATPANKASIYVYRTYPTAGVTSDAQAALNCGDYSVTLGPGGYHRFSVEPGEVLCSSHGENTAEVQLNAKVGEDYYIRQSFSIGFAVARVHLEQVEPDAAQEDIKTCKRQ